MSDWDARDYVLLVGALSGIHADMESSKRAQRKGGTEYNPLLGRHPTNREFDHYGIASGLATAALANMAKSKTRKIGLGALAGFEHALAAQNDEAVKAGKELDLTKPAVAALLGALAGHLLGDDTGIEIGKNSTAGTYLKLSKKF